MADSSKETVSIEINSDLYKDLKDKINGSGFATVDDLVNYVLRTAISKKTATELSEKDTEAVTARLKALGYI